MNVIVQESSPELLTSPEAEVRFDDFQFGSPTEADNSAAPLLPRFRQRRCTIGEAVKTTATDDDVLTNLQQRKPERTIHDIRK